MADRQEKRKIRICYWDQQNRHVDVAKLNLQLHLKMLGDIDLVELQTLNDPQKHPCDLLMIAAENIPAEKFPEWIEALENRIVRIGDIWTPALIFSKLDFNVLEQILMKSTMSNWYFDVIDPDHLNSLPIRVANLLRIHDHLHELNRYENRLSELESKVKQLLDELND